MRPDDTTRRAFARRIGGVGIGVLGGCAAPTSDDKRTHRVSVSIAEFGSLASLPHPDAETWAETYREEYGRSPPVFRPTDVGLRLSAHATEPTVTADHTATVSVSVTNVDDEATTIQTMAGAVVPRTYSVSTNPRVRLLPPEAFSSVEPGCWRPTENIGTNAIERDVRLGPGATRTNRRAVWRDSSEDGCLPTGTFWFLQEYDLPKQETDAETTPWASWALELELRRVA